MANRKNRHKPTHDGELAKRPSRVPLIDYVKRKLEKSRTQRNQETTSEKAERSTARATWVIALFTLITASVAGAQWFILSDTLKDSRQATIEANRAWLVPRVAVLGDVVVGHPITLKLGFDDVGREPALDVANKDNFYAWYPPLQAGLLERKIEENWKACRNQPAAPRALIVFPSDSGIPSQFNMTQLNITNPTVIWDKDFAQLNKSFVLLGCLSYRTGDAVHHTSYCYYRGRDMGAHDLGMYECLAGRYAD